MRSTVRSRMLAVALSGCAVAALTGLTAAPAFAAPAPPTSGATPGATGTAPSGAAASGTAATGTTASGTAASGTAATGTAGTAASGTAATGVGGQAGSGAPTTEPSKCTQTAADTLGWGQPTRQSDFDGTALPPDWHAYGPEPGHDKQGQRTPDQITVADGIVTVAGDEDGNTGAMSWHPGQRYGRWEACVRSDPGAGGYNPVILLWPVKEDWPVGGEIDWMEISSDDRRDADFFLHYGENNDQEHGSVDHDATEWTAWALEWTPQKMSAYVNGKEWYSTTETSHFPPGAMNMTVQLDLFPPAGGATAMQLDWAKQWALPESEPAELSLAPGSPATGQGDLFPDRVPKPLSELPQTDPATTPGSTGGSASSGTGASGTGAAAGASTPADDATGASGTGTAAGASTPDDDAAGQGGAGDASSSGDEPDDSGT